MTQEKVIMYDSPEAAEFKTNIEGWVNSEGRFWGKDEHMARWSGCTHLICECGKTMSKHYTKCEDCRAEGERQRYNALPTKEWDVQEYLYSHAADKYFFSPEDLYEYCEEEEVDPNDLRIVDCDPNYLSTLDFDGDLFPDDNEAEDVIDDELLKMLDELNKKIQVHKPISYSPGKVRIIFPNQSKN